MTTYGIPAWRRIQQRMGRLRLAAQPAARRRAAFASRGDARGDRRIARRGRLQLDRARRARRRHRLAGGQHDDQSGRQLADPRHPRSADSMDRRRRYRVHRQHPHPACRAPSRLGAYRSCWARNVIPASPALDARRSIPRSSARNDPAACHRLLLSGGDRSDLAGRAKARRDPATAAASALGERVRPDQHRRKDARGLARGVAARGRRRVLPGRCGVMPASRTSRAATSTNSFQNWAQRVRVIAEAFRPAERAGFAPPAPTS